MSILQVHDLHMNYGKYNVLKDISFQVEKGDFIGIVGPNGSGKTTLVKGILGLLPISAGRIEVSPGARIGYLPQSSARKDRLFPASVWEVVSMGLLGQKKRPKLFHKADRTHIEQVMHHMEIDQLKHRRIGDLSGGQQQRVHLARSLVSTPDLLILDEPTSALDPGIRENYYNMLSRLNQEGTSILFITHDISAIGKYISKVLYVDRELIFFGDYESFAHSEKMTSYFGNIAEHRHCEVDCD